MLCQDCAKRDQCVKLCDAAEKYVNQDHVSQREIPVTDRKLEIINAHVHIIPIKYQLQSYPGPIPALTPLQNRCLELFYFEGLTYAEIAQKVCQRVSDVTYQIRSGKRTISLIFSEYRGE